MQFTLEQAQLAGKMRDQKNKATRVKRKREKASLEEIRKTRREWMKRDYWNNPEKYRQRAKEAKKKNHEWYQKYHRQWRKERRPVLRRQKILALKRQLGGKCSMCGYDKNLNVLEFHHKDPSTKVGEISQMIGNIKMSIILEEIKKCVLVCRNCHQEIISGIDT